jgi:UMF1 family MFS transporter
MTSNPASAEQRKKILGWTMYDWANSAFTTIIVTFLYSTYFSQAMAPDEVTGTALWSRAISISAVFIAVLSPIAGALADQGGKRRAYLMVTTVTGCVFTAALAFVAPGGEHALLIALTIFVLANIAFEVSGVFYNSFLPDIAPANAIGRISGYGWALGYFGGTIALVVALLAFVGLGDAPGWLGLDTTDGFNIRAVNVMVAIWFLVFSIPMFLWVKDEKPARQSRVDIGAAFAELKETVRHIGRYRDIVRLLLARLVYNDGLVTVFAFGGIYAAGTFGMSFQDVLIFGIALNIAAGVGAALFGLVDDKIGAKKTIAMSLVALSAAVVLAVLAPNAAWFWVAGILFGIFAGPNQSASRSLMGRFVPPKHQAEFFGFFAFSGKATSFAGPLLLGVASQAFGNQRAGVATVLVFFLIGGVLLMRVNETEGIRIASE